LYVSLRASSEGGAGRGVEQRDAASPGTCGGVGGDPHVAGACVQVKSYGLVVAAHEQVDRINLITLVFQVEFYLGWRD